MPIDSATRNVFVSLAATPRPMSDFRNTARRQLGRWALANGRAGDPAFDLAKNGAQGKRK